MKQDYYRDFAHFGDRVWLNCFHQGALPRIAAEEEGQVNLSADSCWELPDRKRLDKIARAIRES